MSLEKHYRAAEEAVADEMEPIESGQEHVPGLYAETAIDAFLSSLADDPPEEMVEAMLWPPGVKLLSKARELNELSLSAALREAVKEEQ